MRARLSVACLVPAGALAGHAASYGLAGAHVQLAPPHGHLPVVASVAVPVALAALAWHVWEGARSRRAPALRLLLVAQPALFLTQEALEHLLGGHGMASLAHSPAVRVGVLAQVVVAALTLLLVRAARTTGRVLVAALRRRRPLALRRESPRRAAPAAVPRISSAARHVTERGPPHLLALT